MKKIFVSQPLRGLNEEESKIVRTAACKMAIKKIADKYGEKIEDLEIIDSFFEDYNPDKGCIPLKYLSSQSNSLLMQTMLILEQDGNTQEDARLSTLVLRSTVSR